LAWCGVNFSAEKDAHLEQELSQLGALRWLQPRGRKAAGSRRCRVSLCAGALSCGGCGRRASCSRLADRSQQARSAGGVHELIHL